jgi:hypothetical protein
MQNQSAELAASPVKQNFAYILIFHYFFTVRLKVVIASCLSLTEQLLLTNRMTSTTESNLMNYQPYSIVHDSCPFIAFVTAVIKDHL